MDRLGDLMYKYGFIGAGNMGGALANALIDKSELAVSNRTEEKGRALADKLGCKYTTNEDIAENAHFVVLAVKPQVLPDLMPTLKTALLRNSCPVLVTMAAGVKSNTLSDTLPVIRIMPNTPVSIGAGVILICRNDKVSDQDFETFINDFQGAGNIIKIDENLIDAASVISGCGPAYIYMFMDALARAGESLGLDYDTAADLAMATAKGSAALAQSSSDSLDELRIKVCSPGGSTIEGVKSFQSDDLDGVVKDALTAAYNRTIELSNS